MKIIKRNGSETDFNKSNIIEAINKANQKVKIEERLSINEIKEIAKEIENTCKKATVTINVEDIQDMVEQAIYLSKENRIHLFREYHDYRKNRAQERQKNTTDDYLLSLLSGDNEEVQQENANKNPTIVSTQRDYMAGIVSKDLAKRYLIPQDIWDAHKAGIIHFHDADYFANPIYNCCLINLDDMLQNGTCISGTTIDSPKRFSTACNIASQVVAQVASSQYGGQTITASHLAKFVKKTREYFTEKYKKTFPNFTEEQILDLVNNAVRDDVKDGVQTLQYQILTLMTTNGQTPFVSICLYLNEAENEEEKENLALVIEEILRQRIQGVKNENGNFYANPFPKLLYVLEEDNASENSKYWYLTELAAECNVKRMVPDYISEKVMKNLKVDKKGNGNCYPCMGCRSFLTPYIDPKTKKPKYYGRFNQGVVTINLPDVALETRDKNGKPDIEKFWLTLEKRLELCHRALRLRHEHLRGVKSDVAPILWQHGAIARLKKGETIDNLLYGGYSTISLGYAGLYETVKILCDKSLTDEEGSAIGQQIMQKLNDKCAEWKQIEKIDYSVYGTPIENTTEKFAKALQRRHGIIEGITDKNFVTNSYHVPVFEEIDAFHKIDVESQFQKLSPGGAISYIETPNMTNNIKAVLTVIKYIYDNIMYCEINSELDWCHKCGGTGTIKMINKDGKLLWHCENCGNEDLSFMNVIRRMCGYLGNANFCAQGRMQDIYNRVKHM